MGLKVITDGRPVTVFANEKETQNGGKFTTYTISIANKGRDGNWVNGYIDCQFKKGVVVESKSKINITNSFYIVNEYNGKKYVKLFILDFEVVESPQPVPPQAPADDSWLQIPDGIDSELPFS